MPATEKILPTDGSSNDRRFDTLSLDLKLRQKAQTLMDDKAQFGAWRQLAETAKRAGLNRTQVRGLENVVNTAQGLASIVNYIFNQIARLPKWGRNHWGADLAKLYEGLAKLADGLMGQDHNPNDFDRALQRQSLILLLARGMTAHFVAYNLFLRSVPRD